MKIDNSLMKPLVSKLESKKVKNESSSETRGELKAVKDEIRNTFAGKSLKVELKSYNEAKDELGRIKNQLSQNPTLLKDINRDLNTENIQYLLRNEEN